MLLSDLFNSLTYGELAQVAIGGKGTGGIAPDDYAEVVSHVNAGLTSLHKRLPLRFEEIHITQYDFIQTYYLKPEFAVTNINSSEPVKYIIDSPFMPFENNVLKIEQVFSEAGEERPINKSNDPLSVYTPKFNAVTLPYAMEGNTFSVMYRANHKTIVVGDGFDPTQVELDIPEALLEPLCIYIAGRIVGNMGSTDNLNASTQYMSRYEMALLEIEQLGLVNRQELENDRLYRNGWE